VIDRLPRVLLRLEGAAIGISAIVVYFWADSSWWLLVVLALAPDLSFLGYAAGPRVGALAYDVAHTYLLAVPLAVVGLLADSDVVAQLGLIWIAHIGIDRALGYGLKYPTRFEDTHLQRV
jgi:hypothetical protein